MQYLGSLDFEPGPHRIELFGAGVHQSFVRAISLELDEHPPPAPVCIDGKRYQVAWGRPATVSGTVRPGRITNCGDLPLLLDWIEPTAG